MILETADVKRLEEESERTVIDIMVARVQDMAFRKTEEDEVKAVIEGIMKYVKYFNSITFLTRRVFDDAPLDEVIVLKEFEAFVIPRTIRMNSADSDCVDLLKYERPDEKAVYDEKEYLDLIIRFRKFFNQTIATDVVKLSDLKKNLSWAEVRDKVCYENNGHWYMHDDTKMAIIPIQLESNFMLSGWTTEYWNTTIEFVIKRYLTKWLVN